MKAPLSGQSLVELMVAIMIGAVFMGGVAAIIGPALIESGQAGKVQVASTNAQSLLNNVRVWSEGNWNNVLSLSTGTAHQYYLITSSSPYTATSGIQSIVIATNTYTDYFYLNDVYRSGGVIATTSTGNTYDPSTKQVTAVYNWAHGVTGTISTYITRNQDKVFYQADWSGGASSSAVVTSTGNQFGSSTNINYSMTGSISVSTGGGGGGSGQNIWLLDSEYPRGYEFSTAGSSELKFGSSQLSYPQFLAFDPNGNLWISDYNLNQVLEFNASGTYERSIGSTGTSTGMFKMPYGVAFDTGGNMYVADYGNIRIQEFSASGSTYVYKSQFGSSGAGQFTSPMDIAFDPSGNAWVTNGFGDNAEDVEKFVASGTSYVYSTTIGTSGSGAGQFAGPTAIAFDSGGNMWISDTLNNRVQKWIASGTTYVYNAQVGSVGTSTNEFESPWGIAFDSGGNMWVVDAGNARVEEFSSSGAYMTTPINTSGFTNTGFGIVIPNGTTTTGTLDSETFDTGVSSGAQLNSVTWQGTAPASTTVGFQFAVSASSTGPWTYAGLDGTSGTMYTGLAGAPIPLSNYPSLKGRYFRYHIILITNGSGTVTPSVQGVSVNWSP